MPPPMFPPTLLDDEGYPIWVTALADRSHSMVLYVVRGLDPASALEQVGARPRQIRPVQLPTGPPASEWSSLALEAVGVAPGDGSALLAAQVGDWTMVYDGGGMTAGSDRLADLSSDGRQAASCSDNIESDTHLAYAADGEDLFWVGEPVSVYRLEELPDGLRPAAQAAGIDWSDDGDDDREWSPAENFRVTCALADLRLTLDHIRALPLLGAAFG
ncbi:MAG TPA: DUF6461 domain-containing protein [Mycobacteriales bacterium]